MTREIKFRGKRLDNGEWEYGSLVILNGRYFIFNDECREEVGPTLGQYTGLKDKNGKEIWEGDFLSLKGKVIGWVKGGVRGYCYDVVYINHPAGESEWSLYSTVKDDYPEQIEVVGNIHDNPELLK